MNPCSCPPDQSQIFCSGEIMFSPHWIVPSCTTLSLGDEVQCDGTALPVHENSEGLQVIQRHHTRPRFRRMGWRKGSDPLFRNQLFSGAGFFKKGGPESSRSILLFPVVLILRIFPGGPGICPGSSFFHDDNCCNGNKNDYCQQGKEPDAGTVTHG